MQHTKSSMIAIHRSTELPKHKAKEKAIQYSEEHNTEKTVIMTVAGATNTKLDYNSLAKGDGRMCTVFDEIAREGEVKGRAFGIIETGLEFAQKDAYFDVLLNEEDYKKYEALFPKIKELYKDKYALDFKKDAGLPEGSCKLENENRVIDCGLGIRLNGLLEGLSLLG